MQNQPLVTLEWYYLTDTCWWRVVPFKWSIPAWNDGVICLKKRGSWRDLFAKEMLLMARQECLNASDWYPESPNICEDNPRFYRKSSDRQMRKIHRIVRRFYCGRLSFNKPHGKAMELFDLCVYMWSVSISRLSLSAMNWLRDINMSDSCGENMCRW